MNRSILVACLCAAALAGCGRTIVREERVVEQPVPAPSATVVAPPAVALASPAACGLSGNLYASGTLSCQGTYEYRCNNGVWQRIEGSSC